jgi:hypothetical protein
MTGILAEWHTKRLISGICLLLLFALACQPTPDQKVPQEAIAVDSSQQEPDTIEKPATWLKGEIVRQDSYTYYVPASASDSAQVFILFFDPQGEGYEPIELYRKLADKYNMVLVGSNESRNGVAFEEARQMLDRFMLDMQHVSGFSHPHMYLAGFSGGAKVALDAATQLNEVRGVLYAGAPPTTGAPPKPIFGFVGNSDMNYADVLHFDQNQDADHPHFLKIWNGSHQWPSREEMDLGFEWLHLRESADSIKSTQKILEWTRRCDKAPSLKEKIECLQLASFLASDLALPDPSAEKIRSLEKKRAWKKIMDQQKEELKLELSLKEQYGTAFFQQDLYWWKSEIADLKAHRKSYSPFIQDRLLGYFSLASYSLASRALQQPNRPLAEKILEIYRLSDPKNAEQAYLRAVYSAGTPDADACLSALNEALNLGFNDARRWEQQAEFQFLKGNASFEKLSSQVKKTP